MWEIDNVRWVCIRLVKKCVMSNSREHLGSMELVLGVHLATRVIFPSGNVKSDKYSVVWTK